MQFPKTTKYYKVSNAKEEVLQCTFSSRDELPKTCILYLHSDKGNAQEGLKYVDQALDMGFDYCTFDFAGCGNSKGSWVTQSWREVGDLHAILKFIYDYGQSVQVVIWGRGLGAVTALLYERTMPPLPIAALVLDTVYADLKEMVKNIAINEIKVDL